MMVRLCPLILSVPYRVDGRHWILVVPGTPERSELLARMARRGPGLIRKWILSLAKEK